MLFEKVFAALSSVLTTYHFHLIASVLVLLAYIVVVRFSLPRIQANIGRGRFKPTAARKAHLTLVWMARALSVASLLFIWGIDFSGLLVMSTTIITLLGVALFASWSLLSNITAFFVLLVHKSFCRGDFIQVIDGDNYIEGYISEINMFSTILVTESREQVVYPNNLLLGRPTVINPRKRYNVIGKITDFSAPTGLESEVYPDAEKNPGIQTPSPNKNV